MTIFNFILYFFISYSYTPGSVNPDFYVLGPGDTLLVASKSTGMAIKTVVLPSGEVPIYTPWMQSKVIGENSQKSQTFLLSAVVNGRGLTIKEFSDTLSHYAKNIFGKNDSFNVMLLGARKVSIEISGAVYHPGIYVLPANYTIADAIWNAGGLKGTAYYSQILLITEKDTTKVNLGSFVHLNSSKINRSISSVQKVFVPFVNEDSAVYIVGDISTPPLASPLFIPIESDTIYYPSLTLRSRVISLPLTTPKPIDRLLKGIQEGNLNFKIQSNKVFIKRNGKIRNVHSLNFKVYPRDSIFIFPLFRGVLVSGETMEPGKLISYTEGATVDYYISKAGGKSELAGPVKILRGFKLIKCNITTIPEDGDVIIVTYSRTKRFSEYISILQGIITLLTLYFAYHK